MKKVLIIGANGFVGTEIVKYSETLENVNIQCAVRGDDLETKIKKSDYVIHTANSPSRYKAQLDPKHDFIESVEKTYKINYFCKKYNKKLTLISSMSARTQLDTVYGMNRRSCEYIVDDKQLIIRLGYMYSKSRIYGALRDILDNKDVYLDKNSEYSFSNVQWNAKKILDYTLAEKIGVFELGSKGSITLNKIAKILNSTSKFIGNMLDIQIANFSETDNPSIKKFIDYLEVLKKDGK